LVGERHSLGLGQVGGACGTRSSNINDLASVSRICGICEGWARPGPATSLRIRYALRKIVASTHEYCWFWVISAILLRVQCSMGPGHPLPAAVLVPGPYLTSGQLKRTFG
jgi:hypothetical protein